MLGRYVHRAAPSIAGLTDLFAAAGKATEDDATYLTVASRSALDTEGVGAVTYKDRFVTQTTRSTRDFLTSSSRVLLRKGEAGVLVAVFMGN